MRRDGLAGAGAGRGEGAAGAGRGTGLGSGSGTRSGNWSGLPLGDFGLFASALLAVSLGLGAFCASCFVAIVGLLIYNSTGHAVGRRAIDYADSYRYVALPVGSATLLVSGLVLLGLWVRRKLRG